MANFAKVKKILGAGASASAVTSPPTVYTEENIEESFGVGYEKGVLACDAYHGRHRLLKMAVIALGMGGMFVLGNYTADTEIGMTAKETTDKIIAKVRSVVYPDGVGQVPFVPADSSEGRASFVNPGIARGPDAVVIHGPDILVFDRVDEQGREFFREATQNEIYAILEDDSKLQQLRDSVTPSQIESVKIPVPGGTATLKDLLYDNADL